MEFSAVFLALIVAAVQNGTPLLFGTVGEILSEKAGNLNLGVEGMMFMGGALGLGGAFYYEKIAGAAANGYIAVLIARRRFRCPALQLHHHHSARQPERDRSCPDHFRHGRGSVHG